MLKHNKFEWKTVDGAIDPKTLAANIKAKADFENEGRKSLGVYVIRSRAPFAFAYPKTRSSILYVGRGYLESRLRAHSTSWLERLSTEISGLKIKAHYLRYGDANSVKLAEIQDAEAALLQRFIRLYEALPLLNARQETRRLDVKYNDSFYRVLDRGQKPTYSWVLRPSGNNVLGFSEYTPE